MNRNYPPYRGDAQAQAAHYNAVCDKIDAAFNGHPINSTVRFELSALDKNIAALADQVGLLQDQLACVLGPVPPKACGSNTDPAPMLCPLAEEIRSHRFRVSGAAAALAELIDRLEV